MYFARLETNAAAMQKHNELLRLNAGSRLAANAAKKKQQKIGKPRTEEAAASA